MAEMKSFDNRAYEANGEEMRGGGGDANANVKAEQVSKLIGGEGVGWGRCSCSIWFSI